MQQAKPAHMSRAMRTSAESLENANNIYDMRTISIIRESGTVNIVNMQRQLPLYKLALVLEEKALGPDHERITNALNGLAGIYFKRWQRYTVSAIIL